MKNRSFPNAPDLSEGFRASHPQKPDQAPSIDAERWPTQDDLEHLDLSQRAYTPGGDLEYQVHRQVRDEQQSREATPAPLPDEKELDFENDFLAASQGNRTKQDGPERSDPEPSLRERIERDIAELRERYGDNFGRDADKDIDR